ncbi:DNA-methyltransferase [Agrobacterium pusense]|uniref:DNA-methyltransferase n=1 Tax=Agrobacterium pusense TaxID=648995 RepID=UPI0022B92A72|nr:site-specific DNA-methyltransferase [Agrobacterium pusense]MCZ7927296.1 site-specific DNA-methyltransferase [Agrobacterium pusense]
MTQSPEFLLTADVNEAVDAVLGGSEFVIYNGPCQDLLSNLPTACADLFMTSPPYFMGKEYDRSYNIDDFYSDLRAIAPDSLRILTEKGNMCWQVGNHVNNAAILPLDYAVYDIFRHHPDIVLRNRIIWQFGHGTHARQRFSGRHETILWYGMAGDSYFDLDAVRVPQKYPGKRHYKGPKKGLFSGNPLGKNPGDVWDIPNVKAKHPEKTVHPCQFPIALAQRLVKAMSPRGGLVLDAFTGSGTSGIAAVMEGRRFVGADTSKLYCEIAIERYRSLKNGTLSFRPIDKEILEPTGREAVSKRPAHFIS